MMIIIVVELCPVSSLCVLFFIGFSRYLTS